MKPLGITILVIGLGLTVFTTFRFFTTEKIVDSGVVEVTREKPHNISWSPYVGVAFMGLGGVLLWRTSKK